MRSDNPAPGAGLETAGRGLHVVDGVLIAPAPGDFDDRAFAALKKDVLAKVHAGALRSVIIDVSNVVMLDRATFELLAGTARMLGLLGARVVFAGFQPGVVSTLVDLDADCGGLATASCLEDALDQLARARPAQAPEDEDAPEDAAGPSDDLPDETPAKEDDHA